MKIEVGMRVIRTRDRNVVMNVLAPHNKRGYIFTVVRIENGWAYEANGTTHGLEVLEEVSLAVALTAAEAEVDRIKAAIEADRLPKRGEVWRTDKGGHIEFHVQHVEDGNVFGVQNATGLRKGSHGGRSFPFNDFTNNFTRVDKTQ